MRLRRSAEFVQVNRAGKRMGTRHLVVRYRVTDADEARFGLAVGRKVGNAVVRNRVKRWLREAIRHQRRQVSGVDVVLIARPGAGEAGFEALSDEVGQALRRIGGLS